MILLDSNSVYKFRSPFIPVPVSSAEASLLKPERYKYKSPTRRRQKLYRERDWLGGNSFIDPNGKCTDFEENQYVKLYNIIHIEKKKSEFYYISIEQGDLDEVARAEIECALDILKQN